MNLISAVATSRLVAQQRALDVTAGNLANMNTPGFRTVRMQFSDWLSRQTGTTAPRGGQTVAFTQDRATWREHMPGPLTHTGNPLDVAITGDGYFTVNTPRGPRLTRDGRFSLQADGTLSDNAGNAVLDTNGRPIQFSPSDTRITVAGDGTISSENGQLAKFGVVKPTNPMLLKAEGDTTFDVTGGTDPITGPGIVQGAVEGSNVQPVLEMTRMLNEQRQFEFMAQFVQAESERQRDSIEKLLSVTR